MNISRLKYVPFLPPVSCLEGMGFGQSWLVDFEDWVVGGCSR
jgi:hypothetical protein